MVSIYQTLIGTLSATNGFRPYVYSLQTSGTVCDAANGTDNDLFVVEGNAFKRKSDTPAGTYDICLQVQDANSTSFQKAFNIIVDDGGGTAPDSAWIIELSSNQVIDGDGPGTLVGTFTSSINGTTFALVDLGKFPLASNFTISGTQLLLNTTVNYDLEPYYPLRVLATEPDGQTQYLDVVIYVMKNGTSFGGKAVPDSGSILNNTTVRLDVVGNDIMSAGATSWASLQIVRHPQHGSAWIGSIYYKADAGYVGTDSLTYRACDNLGYCVTGEVVFHISNEESSAIPSTGFTPDVVTILPEHKCFIKRQDNNSLKIEIPKLGINSHIVGIPLGIEGWDVTWLGNNIGWLNGSAYPTWDGNSVLTGHLYNYDGKPGVFINLHTLAWGDQVIIDLLGKRYIYEVREVEQYVDPAAMNEVSVHKEDPWLTLVTCQGYDERTGSYRWRMFVRAALIRVQ